MEIQVKALAFEQILFSEGSHPTGSKCLQDGRPDAIGIGRQIRCLGHHVESGKQGHALIEDQIHDVALAFAAAEFEGQGGQQRLHGWNHLGSGETRLLNKTRQLALNQPGQEHKQSAQLSFEATG